MGAGIDKNIKKGSPYSLLLISPSDKAGKSTTLYVIDAGCIEPSFHGKPGWCEGATRTIGALSNESLGLSGWSEEQGDRWRSMGTWK